MSEPAPSKWRPCAEPGCTSQVIRPRLYCSACAARRNRRSCITSARRRRARERAERIASGEARTCQDCGRPVDRVGGALRCRACQDARDAERRAAEEQTAREEPSADGQDQAPGWSHAPGSHASVLDLRDYRQMKEA